MRRDHRRRWVLYVVALGVGTFSVLLAPVLFTDETFVGRDLIRVYYPLRQFWADRIRQGAFPGWYPFEALGQPYVSTMISGAFHPSNLLWLLFPPWLALKLVVVSAYAAALAGAYHLVLQLKAGRTAAAFAGLSYACTGYLVSMNNNMLYLLAAATLPWALLAALRTLHRPSWKGVALTAAALSLIALAGDSQAFYVGCGLVLLLGLGAAIRGRPRLASLSLAVVVVALAFALSAAQWLPARALLPETRFANQTLAEAQIWSLSPLRLLEFLAGPVFSPHHVPLQFPITNRLLQEGRGSYWAFTVQLGAVVLVFAAFGAATARRAGVLALLVLLLLATALGKWTPLYGLLFHALPGWQFFRYPEKLVPFVALGAVVLAGLGLRRVERDRRTRRRAVWALAMTAGALLALSALAWGGALHPWVLRLWTNDPDLASSAAIERGTATLALLAGVSTLAAALVLRFVRSRTAAGLALAGISAAQLVLPGRGYVESGPRELLSSMPDSAKAIVERRSGQPKPWPRVTDNFIVPMEAYTVHPDEIAVESAFVVESLVTATPALWGLESADVYLPAASLRVVNLATAGVWSSPAAAYFDIGYVTASSELYRKQQGDRRNVLRDWPEIDLALLENPFHPGRTFLADRRCFPDEMAVVNAIRDLDPGKSARPAFQICTAPAIRPASTEGPGEARITRYEPDRVEVEVTALRSSVLVLNDAWAPGWTARVDGADAPIPRTNYVVRGVDVPAGTHRVEFSFRTPGLRPALALSGMAWLSVVVAFLPRWRRRTRPAGP